MSTTLGSHVQVESCSNCGDTFVVQDSPRKYRCSDACYYEEKGEGALNQIASDHTCCSSCYKYVKSLSTPEQSWLDEKADKVENALDKGGELVGEDGDLTLDATECSTSRQTAAESIIGFQYPTEHTDYLEGKWICECGNGNIHERDEVLAGLELETTITLLLTRLQEFYDKGAIHASPTERVFFETFDKEQRNWELAVGKCLEE